MCEGDCGLSPRMDEKLFVSIVSVVYISLDSIRKQKKIKEFKEIFFLFFFFVGLGFELRASRYTDFNIILKNC
jgi:hypothetical protein